jgi:division protein CdvB (Snf7/Vps24/ESCRT-III family)
MEILIAVIIAFASGWYAGSWVTTHLLALSFRQILNDLGVKNEQLRKLAENVGVELPDVNENTQDGTQLTPLEITLEQHQGVLYAYRKDTKQFLGQGTDQQGLVDSISKRMDNVRLIIDQQDGADLLQKNNS